MAHLRVVACGNEDDRALSGELVQYIGQIAIFVLRGYEQILLNEGLRCGELVSYFHLS